MRLLDALLGLSRPVRPNLDTLFAVPAAAVGLQAALTFVPTGSGAVCFKDAEGPAAARARTDALALLPDDPTGRTAVSTDAYGYTWIARTRTDGDLAALVTDLHAVNTTLVEAGFGPALLCTVIGFADPLRQGRRLALVYLFKRGTFYPFAPTGPQARDTAVEMQVRAQLAPDLPVEADLSRWFPIWGAPAW
jgi:hypothetical protein